MTDRKNGSLYAKTPDYYACTIPRWPGTPRPSCGSIAAAPLLREADRYDHTADLMERVAAVKMPARGKP